MRLSHVNGGAFVAHVNDANFFCVKPHPDRHDMASAEGEHALDAALLQQARDEAGSAIGRNLHFTTPVLLSDPTNRQSAGLTVSRVQESRATSSETVKTANTCEARIEPDVTPVSSP